MQAVGLFIFSVAIVAAASASPQRIVGGAVTTIDQYPEIVALLYSSLGITFTQSCGGSILTTRAILTAAHCTVNDTISNWRVRAGSTYANSGGTVYNTATIIVHANFNANTYENDISIVKTATAISYSTSVQPASIASANYNLADNQAVWAAGWGATVVNGASSEQLRRVEVWTINQATCNTRYSTLGRTISDNMLCTGWLDVGGRDQCQGDSGGPVYHNGVVVGICSFGHSCALAYYPGVNARVSRYVSWIQTNA